MSSILYKKVDYSLSKLKAGQNSQASYCGWPTKIDLALCGT